MRPDGRRYVFGDPDAELPPGDLYAFVDEADGQRRRVLEQLGFAVERRELRLLLPTDPAATGLADAALPPGFAVVHADEVDEDSLRLLDDALRQDVPGTDGWRWSPEDFREETYASPHFDPALYLVGAAPDDRHAGICRIWNRHPLPRLGFVGVVRRVGAAAWRGR